MRSKIGIRPVIDGRRNGVREGLEKQTMDMALSAKKLIESNVLYSDGTPMEVVVFGSTIGGGAEAAACNDLFIAENVTATLTVTPCWCYGSETMDLNPLTLKAVWGFNGTERPGAVYLSAVMSAHAQYGLPAFAIYGEDVQDKDFDSLTPDVEDKILRFARCAATVGQIKDKAYVSIGSVSMGIAGSFVNPTYMREYFGIRSEWVDMSEVLRRIDYKIYDENEFEKALAWQKKNCPLGTDNNTVKLCQEEFDKQWEFTIKTTLIIKDIMLGNEKLKKMGFEEEACGRNAILGGFQGQRQWTDYKPNADFPEAMLNSSFDWNGKREPIILATENDSLNGLAMLFCKLLTNQASIFADIRTYWSAKAVKRVCDYDLDGIFKDGFIHLINSGAAALDGTGACKDKNGNSIMKKWFDVNDNDIANMLSSTKWAPANRSYFRGGGFSSQFSFEGKMPVTLLRINSIAKLGLTMQIAEGYTVALPQDINKKLLDRTDPTWPSAWFVPRLSPSNLAFSSVYNVMAAWGANHGAYTYGHIGKDLITLASMLRIPVSMHNIAESDIFRPHCFLAFGTKDLESADYSACKAYGALYK